MHNPVPNTKRHLLGIFLLSSIIGIIAVSPSSLWIDEAHSAWKAIASTPAEFWAIFCSDVGSDQQMPLYMGLLWVWEKVAGSSEYALRALNIPLFVAAMVIVAAQLRLSQLQNIFYAAFAFASPFIWAYLNELRPYMLQFFAATLIMVPLVNTSNSTEPPTTASLLWFASGIILLCASSLIGVVFSVFFVAGYVLLWITREQLRLILIRKDFWIIGAFGTICLGLLAMYYFWTLQIGAKASGVGKTNFLSIGFCLYELFGFAGLGAARAELRTSGISALKPFFLLIGGYALTIFVFFVTAALATKNSSLNLQNEDLGVCRKISTRYCVVALSVVIPWAVLLSFGVLLDFLVVGRHFMPSFPFLLLGMSLLAAILWRDKCLAGKTATLIMLLLSGYSAILLRFSITHAKDDYRSAAAVSMATIKRGGTVWWAADPAVALYYGLAMSMTSEGGGASFVSNKYPGYLELLPTPDLVVVSKVDIYDPFMNLRNHLLQRGYSIQEEFTAMAIWRKN